MPRARRRGKRRVLFALSQKVKNPTHGTQPSALVLVPKASQRTGKPGDERRNDALIAPLMAVLAFSLVIGDFNETAGWNHFSFAYPHSIERGPDPGDQRTLKSGTELYPAVWLAAIECAAAGT
jgi:hypothetical protein